MPKLKTHKGMKKRFKVSATGKVSHKRCGSSHLNSHKSSKRIRRLRKATHLKVPAEVQRIRTALMTDDPGKNPETVEILRLIALAKKKAEAETSSGAATETTKPDSK